jgi:hypothetical protein
MYQQSTPLKTYLLTDLAAVNKLLACSVKGCGQGYKSDNAFHLKWNNNLQNMYSQLEILYSHQSLVDISITCTDGILMAHRSVLSGCIPYFECIRLPLTQHYITKEENPQQQCC